MARTKASVGAKVTFGKSSKAQKSAAPVASTSGGKTKSSSKGSYSGGNSYCPRETPNWQLPITRFFAGGIADGDGESSGGSRLQPNRDSENEADDSSELIDCDDLDRTASSEVELLPIVDDGTSHKIGDFFSPSNVTKTYSNVNGDKSKNKGVGKGKKNKLNESIKDKNLDSAIDIEESKGKENLLPQLVNGVRKRSLADCSADSNDTGGSKKVKINS